jgi:pimeloyl-ACP methyl ester carboxylesterase
MTARSPRKGARVRSRLALAAVMVLSTVAGLVIAVIAVGVFLSLPARVAIGAAPPELHAETVAIASASGATLSGWFIVGQRGGGAVVLMHGVRSNRLSMVRRAQLLSAAGFSVLLFDFQAHGESTGARITFGRLEGSDARAAVAFVRRRLPTERVGAIGASLGGAAALLGPEPLPVDALVLEAVYPDISTGIANRVRVVLGPDLGGLVARPTAWLFELVLPPVLGLEPADLRPIDHIADVAAPVLVASGTRDNRTTIVETKAMFERAREPKWLWTVAGAGHVDLEAFAPDDYRDRVLPFLTEWLR